MLLQQLLKKVHQTHQVLLLTQMQHMLVVSTAYSWNISQLYIAYSVEGLTIAAASANGAADADSMGLGAHMQ